MQSKGLFWKFLTINLVTSGLLAVGCIVAMKWQQRLADDTFAVQMTGWLLTGFVACVGLSMLAWTHSAAASITGPLKQLMEAVQAMGNGKESLEVSTVGPREIYRLAIAFNRMRTQQADRFEQLRGTNRRLETVLNSMYEGIIAVDDKERILLANGASRQMLGIGTVDVVGRPMLEVIRSRPLHVAAQQTLATGQPVHSEFESNAESRPVLILRATALPGSPVAGAMLVLSDVSELRRLEKLRQEFVANVSHELKTPLAAIKAYAETLQLGAINDADHNIEFVRRIEEQADRLHQLIVDLLQIARIESGQEALEIVDVSITDVVDGCAAQYSNEARLREIDLKIDTPDPALVVLADQDGLRTILENLVDNAFKYTADGGEITVRSWREEGLAVLEVADTGIGISPADQERVFERFFRADKARSREMGGTGLGLSIVKHLCQAFGGSVFLESTPSEGSTFQVRVPIR